MGAISTGLDNSEEQIEYAKELAKKTGVKVSFQVGNMEDLGTFSDQCFEIVLSSFAIGYVENLGKTFQEIFSAAERWVVCIC